MPGHQLADFHPGARVHSSDAKHVVAAQAGLIGYWPYSESADKTENELEINAGENVMLGHTGKRLGRVHDVLFDGGELIGVVIHPDGWWQHDVVVQVRFLDRSDDLALFATLTEKDIENMPPFSPGQSDP